MSNWTPNASGDGSRRVVGRFELTTYLNSRRRWSWAVFCGGEQVTGNGPEDYVSETEARWIAERELRDALRDALESLDFDPAGARVYGRRT